MGLVSRQARLAALVAAAPLLVAGSVALSGTATAYPSVAAQAESKVGTTADFKYDPVSVTVPVGGKVTWTNTGGGYHTVTGGENAKDESSPMQGVIASDGSTYSVTFDKPGTYPYFCEPHLQMGMKGEVIVTAAGGGAGTTTSPGATPSSQPPASAGASASVGAAQPGVGAPTEPTEPQDDEAADANNPTLREIEERRASLHGAVSGFRFFTWVALAFLAILAAAVLFSTRPRAAGK